MTTVESRLDAETLRQDFPILATEVRPGVPLVYLDNAASTQRPRQVIDRMAEVCERHYANVHRGIHVLSEKSTDLYEEAREKVRGFINAPHADQIIFTRGTTESINLVSRSWGDANVGAGDEILLTVMEHHSNIVPWQQLAERTGAVVRFLPIDDDGHLVLDALAEHVTERTKIVALAAVSNVLGTINPVEPIIAAAHAVGAVVLLDAAQSVPHAATDVEALGADFLAFSGHKMLGPSGIGVLWGRGELLAAMPPFQGGGSMIDQVTLSGFTSAEPPTRFEAGTPAIVPAIALATAVDYLERLGMDAIAEHERMLTRRAHELLGSIEGIRLLGPPPEDKAGIVSFVIERAHAHDAAQILDDHGVAVRAGHHCTMPLHERLGVAASVRASFYLYNTPADVERLAEGVAAVRHIFASRPRRRRRSP